MPEQGCSGTVHGLRHQHPSPGLWGSPHWNPAPTCWAGPPGGGRDLAQPPSTRDCRAFQVWQTRVSDTGTAVIPTARVRGHRGLRLWGEGGQAAPSGPVLGTRADASST